MLTVVSESITRRCAGVTTLIAAALALGCVSTAAAHARGVARGRTDGHGAIRLALGPARLVASPGALPPDRRVAIRRLRAPFGSAAAAYAFDVGAHGLRHPVRIELPLPRRALPHTRMAVMYRGRDGRWYVALGTVMRGGRRIAARVSHLSTWAGLDVVGLLDDAMTQARGANVHDDCPGRSDPSVRVDGPDGPLSLCVSGADRQHETVTVQNHGGLALRLQLGSGLDFPRTGAPGILALGQFVPQAAALELDYDATTPSTSIVYHDDLVETFATELAPLVVGGVFGGEGGAEVASRFSSCAATQYAPDFNAAVGASADCILNVVGNDFVVDGVVLAGVGRKALKGLLVLAIRALPVLRPLANIVSGGVQGTITLTTQLPAVGPTPSPAPSPSAPPQFWVHHVYGTCYDGACGLKERAGPGYSHYAQVGLKYDGDEVDIVCQVHGELVGPGRDGLSSDVWDKLTDGAWVTDYYVDTPNAGSFSPPIPQC
jgi:hypothetical protein